MNPRLLYGPAAFIENQIGGQLVQTANQMFEEEVTGVVFQDLDQRSTGAGEEVMAACSGPNAFFDATGKRMREYPMTPKRFLAALAA